jgi:hypothetical protein
VEEERYEQTLTLRRVNRWLLGLTLLPAVLALRLAAAGGALFANSLSFFLLSALGAAWLLGRKPFPSHAVRTVRVEPNVLRVGDEVVPRASIRDARIIPAPSGGLFVRVSRRGLPIDLDVSDRAEGRRLLRALGFDASQTVARFWGASGLMSLRGSRSGLLLLGFPLLFFALGLLLESSPVLWASGVKVLMVLFFATVAASMVPSRIHIGADGVLIRWLGQRKFLPLAEIRTVEQSTGGWGKQRQVGVLFTMRDGTEVWVPIGNSQWRSEAAASLIERVHEAMETHAHGSVEAAAALLVRRDRDVHTWIQELRAIGAGANADLRTAPMNPEHLWRIVESHTVPPEARAAAAVALGPRLDEEGRQRLRVAVEAVADERLRVAVNVAARSDAEEDAALEEALGEVSSPGRR